MKFLQQTQIYQFFLKKLLRYFLLFIQSLFKNFRHFERSFVKVYERYLNAIALLTLEWAHSLLIAYFKLRFFMFLCYVIIRSNLK